MLVPCPDRVRYREYVASSGLWQPEEALFFAIRSCKRNHASGMTDRATSSTNLGRFCADEGTQGGSGGLAVARSEAGMEARKRRAYRHRGPPFEPPPPRRP